MINNLFWFAQINSVGGVESFYWYLVNKYYDKDIVIYYREGDPDQVARLSRFVRCRKWRQGERIQCHRAFLNYNLELLPYIDADEYIQVIHGDYKGFRLKPKTDPKLTKVVCVSKIAADAYTELTGLPAEVSYNPIVKPEPKRVLRLVSATRLTAEKGRDRIIALARFLRENGVLFEWEIFTDSGDPIDDPDIIFRKPHLDIAPFVNTADYLVQLSSHEGYCYSVIEALMMGVPVLITPCAVFKELGIKDGVHGYYLSFEMDKIPLKKILKGVPKFVYDPPEDRWGELLLEGESDYKAHLDDLVPCLCIMTYRDMVLDRLVYKGEIFKVTRERAEKLRAYNVAYEYQEGGE